MKHSGKLEIPLRVQWYVMCTLGLEDFDVILNSLQYFPFTFLSGLFQLII